MPLISTQYSQLLRAFLYSLWHAIIAESDYLGTLFTLYPRPHRSFDTTFYEFLRYLHVFLFILLPFEALLVAIVKNILITTTLFDLKQS